MAATLEVIAPAPAVYNGKHMASQGHSCPECGRSGESEGHMEEAQRRIAELEQQVELLKEKATAAVDRCADYEDQLRLVKQSYNGGSLHRPGTSDSLVPGRPSFDDIRPSSAHSTKASRFSFLTGRRGSPAHSLPVPVSHPSPPAPEPNTELLEQLQQERTLRAKAEEKARKVDLEIEELSVQLFSQANEMVATERKARAKLEARVEQLEKRDREKMARLERLEKAVTRIDRVKALLAAPTGGR